MVERTAHNGLVAGSSPAKLIKLQKLMKLTLKEYKILKTKNYIKNNNLFVFFNGIHQNSTNWIKTEQGLKSQHLYHYKIFNKTSKIIFKKSIYKNTESLINSLTFFIAPNKKLTISKKLLLNLDLLTPLAFKVNQNIYSLNQIKYNNSLIYSNNKLLFYQFNVTNIKACLKINK